MEVREFSSAEAYAVGDMVLYSGILYRFITSHSAGAWNSEQVEPVDDNAEQVLTRIITSANIAENATAFVGTVKFTTAQIEGTRYKCTITDAPDPRI